MTLLSVASAIRPIASFEPRFSNVFFVGITISVLQGLVFPALAQDMCWSTSELVNRFGENKIRKYIGPAYRPVPHRGSPIPSRSRYADLKGGVLRRVDLPLHTKLIAFTFDLCEQPFEISGYQGDIVQILREENVPATFFAGGKWMVTHPKRAEQLLGDPLFEIGNHSWEHRNFRVASKRIRLSEIDGALQAYSDTYLRLKDRACRARDGRPVGRVAERSQTLFRFPFGACTSDAIAEVESRGLLAVQWDISSADPWIGQTVNGMVKSVMTRARSGSIVLFHANGRGYKTAKALRILIPRLRDKGFRFVTVTQLLQTPGARPVTSKTCYDFRPRDVNRYDKLARRIEELSQDFYRRFARGQQAKGEQTREATAPLVIPPVPAQITRDGLVGRPAAGLVDRPLDEDYDIHQPPLPVPKPFP